MLRTLDPHRRSHRRRWQRRRYLAKPLLLVCSLLLAVAIVVWVVFFSSWLAATDVRVSGEQTVGKARIVSAAAVPIGTPLARVNLDEVSRRVEQIPAVASVVVHRSWPHTVDIRVTERQPVASLRRGGHWWLVDKTGVRFRRAAGRVRALPVLQIHSRTHGHDALREAARVVAALPDGLLKHVSRVEAHSMDSIRLVLSNGRQVVWGSAAESGQKVKVLAILLTRKAHLYDVSVPSNPTTRR
jgi:cell division protein FtsQ